MQLQNINLREDRYIVSYTLFSARVIFLYVIVALLILGSSFTYVQISLSQERDQKIALDKAYQKVQKSLDDYHRRFPPKTSDPALQAKIVGLEVQHESKQRVVDRLTTGSFGNTVGFSQHLEGLARQIGNGIWLSKIDIYNGGSGLALSGSAVEANIMPQFLQNLSREEIYRGTDFVTMEMSHGEDEDRFINFKLDTKAR